MKKLLLFITLSLLFTGAFSQYNMYQYWMKFIGGATIGNHTIPGSNVMKQDSVCIIDGYVYWFNGVDTIPIGILVANKGQLSDYALLKHPTITNKTDSDTLVLTDDATFITMNHADTDTISIPTNASVAFQIGTQITIFSIGAAQTSILALSGVTTISQGDNLDITLKSAITLIKIATNTWFITGALE